MWWQRHDSASACCPGNYIVLLWAVMKNTSGQPVRKRWYFSVRTAPCAMGDVRGTRTLRQWTYRFICKNLPYAIFEDSVTEQERLGWLVLATLWKSRVGLSTTHFHLLGWHVSRAAVSYQAPHLWSKTLQSHEMMGFVD